MKLNELNVDDSNAEMWIELEGKLVKVGQSYVKTDAKSNQSKLVMVPIKPRQRAKLIKKGVNDGTTNNNYADESASNLE